MLGPSPGLGLEDEHNATTVTAFAFDITGDHTTHIWAIRNPVDRDRRRIRV
jgi:hypothetical protein